MNKLQDYLDLLDKNQIKKIKKSNKEYTFFNISVFNVGPVARLEFSNDILLGWSEAMDDNEWNGADTILFTEELQEILERV